MTLFAPPTLDDMLLARGALATMAKRRPQGFATLTWVLPQAGYRMDDATRKAASDVTRAFAKSILAEATLIEGTGFQAAAVRAIISGLDAMSRTGGEKKVFSDLAAAVAWCADRGSGPRPSPTAVADATRVLAAARPGP